LIKINPNLDSLINEKMRYYRTSSEG
jgi:hypothetical protein